MNEGGSTYIRIWSKLFIDFVPCNFLRDINMQKESHVHHHLCFCHFHPNQKNLRKKTKKSESARKPKKSESAWNPKNLNLLEGGAWHGAVNLPLLTHLLLTSHNPLSTLFLWDQDMKCGGIMIWWLFVLMILSMILDNTKARGLVYFKKIQEIKEGK